jgi:hypothetical protein
VRTRTFRGKVQGKVPFAGGLCTVIGKPMVLLNANASAVERSVALADALATQPLGELEMTAAARRFLAERARSRSGVVEPDSAPRPGLVKTASPRKKKPQQQ